MKARTWYSLIVIACVSGTAVAQDEKAKAEEPKVEHRSVHDFEVTTIDGEKVKLDKYKGNVLLIVNVASKCGLTDSNYKGLEPLYRKYKDRGLRVLAFPANDFMAQEPGTNADIKQFCTTKYNVSFDLFSKVSVKGDDICPLYAYLTNNPDPKVAGPVEWNFQKYVIDGNGEPIEMFSPRTAPDDEKLIAAIEAALAKLPQEASAEEKSAESD